MPSGLSYEKIRTRYSEYEYNIRKNWEYRRKIIAVLVLWVILLIVFPYLQDKIKPNSVVYSFFLIMYFLIILLGMPFLSMMLYRKSKRFDIGEKGRIIYDLLTISNLLSEFLKSEIYTKNLEKAIQLNRNLEMNLRPASDYTYSFKHRGYLFDEKLVNFLRLLKKVCSNHFKRVLEGKRVDKKLKITMEHYRNIALMLEEEKLDEGIDYLKRNFSVELDEEAKLKELFYKYYKKGIFRWALSIFITLALLFGALKIGWVELSKPPVYMVPIIFSATVGVVVSIERIITKILDSLEMKK